MNIVSKEAIKFYLSDYKILATTQIDFGTPLPLYWIDSVDLHTPTKIKRTDVITCLHFTHTFNSNALLFK